MTRRNRRRRHPAVIIGACLLALLTVDLVVGLLAEFLHLAVFLVLPAIVGLVAYRVGQRHPRAAAPGKVPLATVHPIAPAAAVQGTPARMTQPAPAPKARTSPHATAGDQVAQLRAQLRARADQISTQVPAP